MEEIKRYPICPACQSYEFVIEGLVGYRQWYNSHDGDHSASKIDWDADLPAKGLLRAVQARHDRYLHGRQNPAFLR
ncbi:MAG: hypothetical protein HY645_13485 [Acidobacteria bacterium]|nr:hypothetical protein [Acidobacteriota bacterium]